LPRPLERAQQVCLHSSTLAASEKAGTLEQMTVALLRTAHQDQATLEHSLVLYRNRLRDHPLDAVSHRGAELMSSVLRFLGASVS